jgi:hypothetical protein
LIIINENGVLPCNKIPRSTGAIVCSEIRDKSV